MRNATDPELSIVIPVYGSAAILPDLAAALADVLEAPGVVAGFEVVLVHDCGPDRAWEVIVEIAARHPWLRGINLRRNAGQHNALMAGLAQARGRYIVTMDDDLQHAPGDIPRLLAPLRAGADVVYAQFRERHHATWKRLGSAFNDLGARWLLRKPAGLYLSPFRALRAEIRDAMLRYAGPFVYLDGLILQSTSRIATIDAAHHARRDGRSGYSLRKSVSLWLQMATSFSVAPLRFATVSGIAFSALGFLLAIVIVVQKLLHPDIALGWTSLIVAVLLLGGIQMLALGVIGEYVGRVLLNVTRSPQFVVGERVGFASDALAGAVTESDHRTGSQRRDGDGP